jgi:ATP-dependent helicase/nuclease subunit A
MIDEFQDVNAVQEMIFTAVSDGGRNIFMVGDVKQSIYRFRLADPGIFMHKYRTFADFRKAKDGEGRKVILSKNFRSRNEVLACVNYVFSSIMSLRFGRWTKLRRISVPAPCIRKTLRQASSWI